MGPGKPKLQILHVFCDYEYRGSLSSAKTGWVDAESLLRRVWVFKIGHDIILSTSVDGYQEVEDDDVRHASLDDEDDWVSRPRFEEMKKLKIFLLLVATDEDLSGKFDSRH